MSKTSLAVRPQLLSGSDNIGLPCCGLDALNYEGQIRSIDSCQSLSPRQRDGQTPLTKESGMCHPRFAEQVVSGILAVGNDKECGLPATTATHGCRIGA